MIFEIIVMKMHIDTNEYVSREKRSIPLAVILRLIYILLSEFPSGLTSHIMISELESRWRAAIKRCEYSGKLQQGLTNKYFNSHDTLRGQLQKIDDFRYY